MTPKRHMGRVAELPCSVCGASGPSIVHHPRFAAGMGQRSPDWLTIALCYECHQGQHGIHGDRARWAVRKMDEPQALAVTIQRLEDAS